MSRRRAAMVSRAGHLGRLVVPAAGVALCTSVLLGTSPTAAAAPAVPAPAGTVLTLALPPPTKTGQAAALTGSLLIGRHPLVRAAVHLVIDGVPTLTLETGPDGSFLYKFPRDLPAGRHAVYLWYHGSQPLGLAPASAVGTLTLLPMTLTLQTLPALNGARFSVDGQTYVTDAEGKAQAQLAAIGTHQLGVAPPADTDITRYRLVRWLDGEATADREIRVFEDKSAVATFSSTFLVPISFEDGSGASLDPSRLSNVIAVGPGGATVDVVPSRRSAWLTLPAPSHSALRGQDQPARFVLGSAKFDGVSVANHGDAPYVPSPGRLWTIRLRVYSIRVHVRQPPLGHHREQLAVRSDLGVERSAEADARGEAVFRDLPRGLYDVTVRGARIGPGARVQVTRNQAVDITVYTISEIALGLLTAVMVLLGTTVLALLVRRRLRSWRSARPTLAGLASSLAAIKGGRR